jgi:lambda family phage tail tape measure protein
MSLIARLGVILGIDTSQFVSGVDTATKKTREFEMNQKRALRNAQKAQEEAMQTLGKATIALAGFGTGVVAAFQYADKIDETAKAFDVTTASLVAMQAAFIASGGQADFVEGALQKLAIAQQGARDGSDELRESFKKLGISGKDVQELKLPELFKRVAFELSKVSDTTQRTALQTDLLGKAVRGTDWRQFVANYKELGNPNLLMALQENAKAWGNIEAAIKSVYMVIQQMVAPFALLVNHMADLVSEYKRLTEGGSTEIDFGAALGGAPGEAIVGQYGASPDEMKSVNIAKTPQQGNYKTLTDKEKKIAEARKNLQEEIKLLVKRADINSKMFLLDQRAVMVGEKAVSEEKLRLNLATDLANIRSTAAKDRQKEGAQIDLINKKEAAQIAVRLAQYNQEEKLRQEITQRQLQLTLQSIEEEKIARTDANEIAVINQMDLFDVEKQRFELGADQYDLKKLDVETENRMRELRSQYLTQSKAINKEYELSAKTAEDLEIYEAKINALRENQLQLITWTTAQEKQRKEVMEGQLDINKKLLMLDLEQQKEKELRTIEAQTDAEKRRLDIERKRYELTVNEYNMATMLLDNTNQLIEAERKYNELMQEAYYEMQRQGGGQRAREQYEMRVKMINEVKDAELKALKEVNEKREENFQKDILRQQSWAAGWQYASMRYQENSLKAFERGEKVFGTVMANMENAIGNFVDTGKFKFSEFAGSVIKDILRMEMQAQAAQLVRGLLQFIGMGARTYTSMNYDAGIARIPMAANGGDINGPTIVGEMGPELFIPKSSGTVIPNNKLSSFGNMGTSNYVTNNYINAIDVKSFEERIMSSPNAVWAANQYANKSLQLGRGRT